jgi:hypothetical protein
MRVSSIGSEEDLGIAEGVDFPVRGCRGWRPSILVPLSLIGALAPKRAKIVPNHIDQMARVLERAKGIEPSHAAWELNCGHFP